MPFERISAAAGMDAYVCHEHAYRLDVRCVRVFLETAVRTQPEAAEPLAAL